MNSGGMSNKAPLKNNMNLLNQHRYVLVIVSISLAMPTVTNIRVQ